MAIEESFTALKVVVAGDGNVGKTSLIRQYCEGKFDISRVSTIGVDFQTQTVKLPDITVKLSIWDMAGQPHFKAVRESFYKGSRATALVFDLTNIDSLKNLVNWYEEITSILPDQRFVVIGNKTDLERHEKSVLAQSLAERLKAPYVETSAKTADGVPNMFETLAKIATGRM